jgi:hypothetical protein
MNMLINGNSYMKEHIKEIKQEIKNVENQQKLIFFDQKITTINDKNDNYESFLRHYSLEGKEIFEKDMNLYFKIVFLKHKLKYYENLIWQNKITLVISWLSSLFQKLYICVIFLSILALVTFAAILIVLILNSIIYQFLNTAVMMSHVQCVH